MALELEATKEKTTQERYWPPVQGDWTYRDYVRLPADHMRYEVIEGDLYMSPAPRPQHQKIVAKLHLLLGQHAQNQQLGEVFFAPVDVILPGVASPVQPDLLFIAGDNLDMVKEKYIEGTPDLIVEVLSPGNPSLDREIKFEAYAKAGVPEYWIVDPETRAIEIFVRRGRAYALLGKFGAEEQTRSEVLPDFSLKPGEVCP